MIIDTIIESAKTAGMYDNILTDLNNEQNTEGIFALGFNATKIYNELTKFMNVKDVAILQQNIRNTYHNSNTLEIVNDELQIDDYPTPIEIKQTNKNYNETVSKAMLKELKIYEDKSNINTKQDNKQTTKGLDLGEILQYAIIAAGIGLAGLVIFKSKGNNNSNGGFSGPPVYIITK
jgi:hypothetical protein